MKIVTVIGNRPQFVKAAAVSRPLRARHHELLGDVMVDIALLFQPRARERPLPVPVNDGFLLATAHRAGNVDDPERLRALVELLCAMPGQVVLPLHPRTRARLEGAGLLDRVEARLQVTPPLGYVALTALPVRPRP